MTSNKSTCPNCKREIINKMLYKGEYYCLKCHAELTGNNPDWRYE